MLPINRILGEGSTSVKRVSDRFSMTSVPSMIRITKSLETQSGGVTATPSGYPISSLAPGQHNPDQQVPSRKIVGEQLRCQKKRAFRGRSFRGPEKVYYWTTFEAAEDVGVNEDHLGCRSPRVMTISCRVLRRRFQFARFRLSTTTAPRPRRFAFMTLTPSSPRTNASLSPAFQPKASRTSFGTVTCPFTVIVLVFTEEVLLGRYYQIKGVRLSSPILRRRAAGSTGRRSSRTGDAVSRKRRRSRPGT